MSETVGDVLWRLNDHLREEERLEDRVDAAQKALAEQRDKTAADRALLVDWLQPGEERYVSVGNPSAAVLRIRRVTDGVTVRRVEPTHWSTIKDPITPAEPEVVETPNGHAVEVGATEFGREYRDDEPQAALRAAANAYVDRPATVPLRAASFPVPDGEEPCQKDCPGCLSGRPCADQQHQAVS